MIADARPRATISFDPNCRPNLVKDKEAYRARMSGFAASADIIRMSDVDFNYLYGEEAYAARAESFLAKGSGLFVVTRGMIGAEAWHRNTGPIAVGAPVVDVVDTIGAGDSFQSALLFALHFQGRLARHRLAELGIDELRLALSFACNCAALTCMRVGADPPWRGEITWVGQDLSGSKAN
jgi:fructokinase